MSIFDPNTSLTIASTTDASPIAVTFAGNHGLATGDQLAIFGHMVNVAANGQQTITVTGLNSCTLNGTMGSGAGAGGATGVAIPFTSGGISLIDDGNDVAAAVVDPPLAALADRVGFLRKLTVLKVVNKTTLGSYTDTVPDGARYLLVENATGGGGGGGGGAGGGTSSTGCSIGGGAGGGAQPCSVIVPVIPGQVISGTVGDGGAGGAGGAIPFGNGTGGSVGAASTCVVPGSGTYTFPGGGGGGYGTGINSTTTAIAAAGGPSCGNSLAASLTYQFQCAFATPSLIAPLLAGLCRTPGEGGYASLIAASTQLVLSGQPSITGFPGGTAGAYGGDFTGKGGTGGAGGGGGVNGAGGAGGAGGFGNLGGGAGPGVAGTAAAAGSGAGGGGGGGGGTGSGSSGGVGAAGGKGGSGKVTLVYLGAPQ